MKARCYVLDELLYILDIEKGTLTVALKDHTQATAPTSGFIQLQQGIWVPEAIDDLFRVEPRPFAKKLKNLVVSRAKTLLSS